MIKPASLNLMPICMGLLLNCSGGLKVSVVNPTVPLLFVGQSENLVVVSGKGQESDPMRFTIKAKGHGKLGLTYEPKLAEANKPTSCFGQPSYVTWNQEASAILINPEAEHAKTESKFSCKLTNMNADEVFKTLYFVVQVDETMPEPIKEIILPKIEGLASHDIKNLSGDGSLENPYKFSEILGKSEGTMSFQSFGKPGAAIVMSCSTAPAWVKSAGDTSKLNFEPKASDQVETANFNCNASDGENLSKEIVYFSIQTLDPKPKSEEIPKKKVNSPPTLSKVANFVATEDVNKTILYADMLANADEADIDGDALSFELIALTSGTLTTDGTTAVNVGQRLASGGQWVWKAAANTNGSNIKGFTIKAWDGTVLSSSAVSVKFDVAAANDAPTLTTVTN